MISISSRYAQSTVVVASGFSGNDVQAIVPSQQTSYSFSFVHYMTKQYDTLPEIASDNYGDPTLWWQIADANPETLLWDSIPPGSIIRIPVANNVA